jgi:hypothetical protein
MRRTTLIRFIVIHAVAVIATACLASAVIDVSRRSGRLATFPRVDGVLYLARGAELYDALRSGGVRALATEYAANPPHSPGASLSALASFAFALVAVLFVAACPGLVASLQNLKPDYACGMLTAIGIAIVIGCRVRTCPSSAVSPWWLRMMARQDSPWPSGQYLAPTKPCFDALLSIRTGRPSHESAAWLVRAGLSWSWENATRRDGRRSVAVWCVTARKSGRRDSNPQHPAWKAGTLPLSYARVQVKCSVARCAPIGM